MPSPSGDRSRVPPPSHFSHAGAAFVPPVVEMGLITAEPLWGLLPLLQTDRGFGASLTLDGEDTLGVGARMATGAAESPGV